MGKEPFYPLRVCLLPRVQHDAVGLHGEEGDHVRRPHLSLGCNAVAGRSISAVAKEVDGRLLQRNVPEASWTSAPTTARNCEHFQALGYDVLGVESSKTTARIANDAGVPTLNEFFNLGMARRLGRKFDVINAAGRLLPPRRTALGDRRHPRSACTPTGSSSSSSST